jgi:hypothetical protein
VEICYSTGAWRPAPHSAQRPKALHCNCSGDPEPPSKSRNTSSLIKGRKEVIGTTARTLQKVTYPAYPSLTNTAGAPVEKNSKPQLQQNKRLKP